VPGRHETLVYHFTHLDNLPALLREGALLADVDLPRSLLATDVGDPGVKSARRRRRVPIAPGGVVADYVPFYFAPRSPMLYRIACDHRDQVPNRYDAGEDPLVYLVSSIDRIAASGAAWLATDGNAAAAVSHFTRAVDRLPTFIDWPLMTERIWANDTADPDRQRRRMAELLVHRRLSLSALAGFATKTTETRRRVRTGLAAAGRTGDYVAVRPDWYYELGGPGVGR
jgi:ssDNA thymidine ADP-ribosyltransferase, DarT